MSGKHNGFTLIELMVVLAIVLIMSAVAAPNLIGAMSQYRLKNSARDLCANMRKARAVAVKQRKDVIMKFNIKEKKYFFEGHSIALEQGVAFGYGSSTEPAGTTLPAQGTTFASNRITFNSRGIISNNSGFVYLQNEKKQTLAIGANTAGRIYLKQWMGSSWK